MGRARYLALTVGVVILDLLTKGWILQNFGFYDRQVVIPGLFNLVHVRNTGAAFGLGAGAGTLVPFLLTLAAIVVLVLVTVYAFRAPLSQRLLQTALHLVMGGAIGNLIDRFRFGSVIDFLDFYVTVGGRERHWPAFNVADSAIVIGILLLLLDSRRSSRPA